jgi:hypothetical protein
MIGIQYNPYKTPEEHIEALKKCCVEYEEYALKLEKEKKQILAEITKVRIHYSEYEGVWNALTKVIDTHS